MTAPGRKFTQTRHCRLHQTVRPLAQSSDGNASFLLGELSRDTAHAFVPNELSGAAQRYASTKALDGTEARCLARTRLLLHLPRPKLLEVEVATPYG